jgi:signal peptidase II
VLSPLPPVILTLTYNKGIAFGILSHHGDWGRLLLISIAILVLGGIAYLHHKIKNSGELLKKLALTLIASGTLGNLIDRIHTGAVIDFITLAYRQVHWPTIFNVADMFITLGAILLIIDTFMAKEAVKEKG